jgi:hypothetical protein
MPAAFVPSPSAVFTARALSYKDRNADSAWLTDGVKAGESVILYPGSGMGEGRSVEPWRGG